MNDWLPLACSEMISRGIRYITSICFPALSGMDDIADKHSFSEENRLSCITSVSSVRQYLFCPQPGAGRKKNKKIYTPGLTYFSANVHEFHLTWLSTMFVYFYWTEKAYWRSNHAALLYFLILILQSSYFCRGQWLHPSIFPLCLFRLDAGSGPDEPFFFFRSCKHFCCNLNK